MFRHRRIRIALATVVLISAAGITSAIAARSSSRSYETKAQPGDLIIFRAADAQSLGSGGPGVELFDFPLAAGSWLLLGEVTTVRGTSNTGPVDVSCTLLESESTVELPARNKRTLTLQASIKLKTTKTVGLRCRVEVSPNPAVVAEVARVSALRVRTTTSKTM
jgi:hypothetical protein